MHIFAYALYVLFILVACVIMTVFGMPWWARWFVILISFASVACFEWGETLRKERKTKLRIRNPFYVVSTGRNPNE